MIAKFLIAVPDSLFGLLAYANYVIAVLAGLLLGVGLAGRRSGWGPRCRKCAFQLRGVPEEATTCPECGASLTRRGAIAFGARSVRWGALATGVVACGLLTCSVLFMVPTAVIQWRERVIAEHFDLKAVIDLAISGNARAISDLSGELSGMGRRSLARAAGNMAPGQSALIAVVERMEGDPGSRAKLLPILLARGTGFGAIMWVRESILSVRLAAILGAVATDDPVLFDSLSGSSLNDLFRGGNNPAPLRELLSHPAIVKRLYRGGTAPEQRVNEAGQDVQVHMGPSFGGQDELWMNNTPVLPAVRQAEWRTLGAQPGPWTRVTLVRSFPMTGGADLILEGLPASGQVEIRVSGVLLQGAAAELTRAKLRMGDLREMEIVALPVREGVPAPPEPAAFEWTRVLTLKPRSELVLKPSNAGGSMQWVESTLSRTSVVPVPGGSADDFQVMTELQGSINNAAIALAWTLEQDDRTWKAVRRRDDSRLMDVVAAPGFDPARPFLLHARSDVDAIRAAAPGDCEYLDLDATLKFDSVNRTPAEVGGISRPAPTLQPGTGGSRR